MSQLLERIEVCTCTGNLCKSGDVADINEHRISVMVFVIVLIGMIIVWSGNLGRS